MKNTVTKLGVGLSSLLMVAVFANMAHAAVTPVPEVDSSSVGAALALLVGTYLVAVSKFRRK
jgi:hypothetical protein